jgi:hypothetical protein
MAKLAAEGVVHRPLPEAAATVPMALEPQRAAPEVLAKGPVVMVLRAVQMPPPAEHRVVVAAAVRNAIAPSAVPARRVASY